MTERKNIPQSDRGFLQDALAAVGVGMSGFAAVLTSIVLFQRFGSDTWENGQEVEYMFSLAMIVVILIGIGLILIGVVVLVGKSIESLYNRVSRIHGA